MSKLFEGFNVFISRHLFPPREFDAVHKVVEENGGQVHIGFDLSRNGENDYHIISCRKHVRYCLRYITTIITSILLFDFFAFFDVLLLDFQHKFEDLKSKGCKMIGMYF